MEQYMKGETYNRSMSIVDSIVTINHVSDVKDGKHYMQTKLDLGDMDGDSIVKHAAMNILIQIIRPRYLKLKKSVDIDESIVHNPLDYPAAKGGGINKREMKIQAYIDVGFSKEDAFYAADHPEAAKKALNGRVKLRKNKDKNNNKNHKKGQNTQE